MRSQRAAGAYVSRAQIAAGIVCDRPLRRQWFDLSLSRTIVPPGRYQHPLTAERIESPVRLFVMRQRWTLNVWAFGFGLSASGLHTSDFTLQTSHFRLHTSDFTLLV